MNQYDDDRAKRRRNKFADWRIVAYGRPTASSLGGTPNSGLDGTLPGVVSLLSMVRPAQTVNAGRERARGLPVEVQTGAQGRPVLASDGFNLRAAEAALLRHVVQHAETLAAAAAMLGITARQLRSKARGLRVALPFARRGGRS